MVDTLGQKFNTMGQKLVLGVIIFVLWFKSWYYGSKVGTWGQKLSPFVKKLVLGAKSLVQCVKSLYLGSKV